MNRIMGVIGALVTVTFVAMTLTPIPNYVSGHFAIKPMIRPAGAIVVLGGGVWKGDMLGDASLRRTIYAIELYEEHFAPVIVFSGPQRSDVPTKSEAEIRMQLALTMGLPENAIIKEESAKTTREESIRISNSLRTQGIHSILLVT